MSKRKRILGVIAFVICYLTIKGISAGMRANMRNNSSTRQSISLPQIAPVNAKPSAALTADGSSRITLPAQWTTMDHQSLPKNVILRAAKPSQQTELLVARLPKFPNATHEQLAPLAKETATKFASSVNITNPKIKQTSIQTINGYPAAQYEVEGIPNKPYQLQGKALNEPVVIVITSIAAPTASYNIAAVAPVTAYNLNHAEIQQVIQGFQEQRTAKLPQL